MTVTILEGNAPDVLRSLPAKSVQCVVTSPPYWALRRYGTPPQIWSHNGPGSCEYAGTDHEWGDELRLSVRGPNAGASAQVGNTKAGVYPAIRQQGAFCQRCGAWRGELGSEPTPDLFLSHLVSVFDEVWRVLRDDGCAFVNLGDSYASGWATARGTSDHKRIWRAPSTIGERQNRLTGAIKEKDLCLIPWQFALAMRARGWYVRSVVVWGKLSAMPESVVDRPTSAWEPVFLFTKAPRYFYDAEAVRQAWADDRNGASGARTLPYSDGSWRNDTLGSTSRAGLGVSPGTGGANLRNVWMLPPEPSREEHYAVYPTEIPRRCIKAGTSEKGACAACGAPWRRVAQKGNSTRQGPTGSGWREASNRFDGDGVTRIGERPTQTVDWQPSCACNAGVVPCTVLDPFGGSGTTGVVADQLGRDAILIELKPDYAEMAERRVRSDAPMLADVVRLAPGERIK